MATKKPLPVVLKVSVEQAERIAQMPGLSALLGHAEAFGRYLVTDKGYSPKTRIDYLTDLRLFFAYLADAGRDITFDDLTPDVARSWLAAGIKLSVATRNRRIATLRSWIRFLVKTGVLKVDPLAGLESAKRPKRLPRPMAEDQIEALFKVPSKATANGLRDRAILELLYGAGLRISEACSITSRDLQLTGSLGPEIRIRGKGSKDRVVPLTEHFLAALREYLAKRPSKDGGPLKPGDYIFLARGKNPVAPNSFRQALKRYLAIAGLDYRLTPHKLRHSYASHLLANGADIRAIQELLGHADLSSTQIYTKVTNAALHDTVRNKHPRS
jgi:integrase/recombinase XerD